MQKFSGIALILTFIFISGTAGIAYGKEDIGKVVALKGNAVIERERKEIEAKVKSPILLDDSVLTKEASRAKLLFIDDSVLTIGEKSRVVIKEFVYSKDKGGKSIFNLLDGKMRSVVGKTEFEVHTPTVVTAARGTIILFETGIRDGKWFTTVISLEGFVDVMNIDPSVAGKITLTPGMMVTVFEKQPPPPPSPAPKSEMERLKGATSAKREVSAPSALGVVDVSDKLSSPPIQQQPVKGSTPVNIDVNFPQ